MSGNLRVMFMIIVFFLCGCGQSGPLYLPTPHQPPTTSQHSNY
jgi:predicted small lipoprotein YifL